MGTFDEQHAAYFGVEYDWSWFVDVVLVGGVVSTALDGMQKRVRAGASPQGGSSDCRKRVTAKDCDSRSYKTGTQVTSCRLSRIASLG